MEERGCISLATSFTLVETGASGACHDFPILYDRLEEYVRDTYEMALKSKESLETMQQKGPISNTVENASLIKAARDLWGIEYKLEDEHFLVSKQERLSKPIGMTLIYPTERSKTTL